MRRLRHAGRAAAILAALSCAGAHADTFQSSLTATVSLTDGQGNTIERPERGSPFRIGVVLMDAVTRTPPKGMLLQAWIRPLGDGAMSCQDAARAFRVTRSIAEDSVDLNGIVLAQLNRDGSFGIVDPKLNLRSSNMIGAARFDAQPDGFAVDPRSQTAYFAFADTGTVEAVSLVDGARKPFAKDLHRPTDIAVGREGDVWVAQAGAGDLAHFSNRGERLPDVGVGSGGVAIVEASDGSTFFAYAADGSGVLVDRAAGQERARVHSGQGITSAATAGAALVLLERDGMRAQIRFADAPKSSQSVPLAGPAARVAIDPSGTHAFAFSGSGNIVTIVDIATAQVVQAVSVDGAVTDMAFTDRAVYLMLADQSAVLVIDPATIALGRAPSIRRVPIGVAGADTGTTKGLLVPLLPSRTVLAVNAESYTGFILHEEMAIGDVPPMDSVRLRGGVPMAIKVADRNFREVSPGRYETFARIARPGQHELVLTTGIAGMTVCFPIRVEGAASESRPAKLTLRVTPAAGGLRAGVRQTVFVDVVDDEGQAYSAESVELIVPSLSFSWTGRFIARRDGGGRLAAEILLPRAGTYAVQPSANQAIAPATLEVGS